jgi:isocitrate/isopropylmalate dehydrogenase
MAAVLSAAMMLRDAHQEAAAARIEAAVDLALTESVRTPDVGGNASTVEVGSWLAERVRNAPI